MRLRPECKAMFLRAASFSKSVPCVYEVSAHSKLLSGFSWWTRLSRYWRLSQFRTGQGRRKSIPPPCATLATSTCFIDDEKEHFGKGHKKVRHSVGPVGLVTRKQWEGKHPDSVREEHWNLIVKGSIKAEVLYAVKKPVDCAVLLNRWIRTSLALCSRLGFKHQAWFPPFCVGLKSN